MPNVPRKPASTPHLTFIPPLKPTLSAKPPEGEGWLHEIKLDGYRTELIVEKGVARAFTMNGHEWTERYSELVNAAAKLKCKSAILDGEAVVQDKDGRPDFHALRRALSAEAYRVTFFAFDLLHLDGQDLRKLTLVERRAALGKVLRKRRPDDPIQFSEAIEGSGAEVFKAAEQMGLEGIVSKRKQSRYESGSSQAWMKTKCTEENEFIVVGAEPNPGGPPYALLARETGEKLVYAGSAFVTLSATERDRFWQTVEALKESRPAVKEIRRSKAAFVKPKLRVRSSHARRRGAEARNDLEAPVLMCGRYDNLIQRMAALARCNRRRVRKAVCRIPDGLRLEARCSPARMAPRCHFEANSKTAPSWPAETLNVGWNWRMAVPSR